MRNKAFLISLAIGIISIIVSGIGIFLAFYFGIRNYPNLINISVRDLFFKNTWLIISLIFIVISLGLYFWLISRVFYKIRKNLSLFILIGILIIFIVVISIFSSVFFTFEFTNVNWVSKYNTLDEQWKQKYANQTVDVDYLLEEFKRLKEITLYYESNKYTDIINEYEVQMPSGWKIDYNWSTIDCMAFWKSSSLGLAKVTIKRTPNFGTDDINLYLPEFRLKHISGVSSSDPIYKDSTEISGNNSKFFEFYADYDPKYNYYSPFHSYGLVYLFFNTKKDNTINGFQIINEVFGDNSDEARTDFIKYVSDFNSVIENFNFLDSAKYLNKN